MAVILASLIADGPKTHYHRNGFAGREPVWVKAETNVSVEEKDHRIVTDRYYNAPSSEYLKIEAKPSGKADDAEYAHYAYDTPKCPLVPSDGTTASASLWVRRSSRHPTRLRPLPQGARSSKSGYRKLSALILGESYLDEKVRSWQRLTLGNPAETLQKQLPAAARKDSENPHHLRRHRPAHSQRLCRAGRLRSLDRRS